jgi:hypothetical protein
LCCICVLVLCLLLPLALFGLHASKYLFN